MRYYGSIAGLGLGGGGPAPLPVEEEEEETAAGPDWRRLGLFVAGVAVVVIPFFLWMNKSKKGKGGATSG